MLMMQPFMKAGDLQSLNVTTQNVRAYLREDQVIVFCEDDYEWVLGKVDNMHLAQGLEFVHPLEVNRAHTDVVVNSINVQYSGNVIEATVAGEYRVHSQVDDGTLPSEVKVQAEQTAILMEGYRQYRCHKTLITLCETIGEGGLEAATYMVNRNQTFKMQTPRENYYIIAAGFTEEGERVYPTGSAINSKELLKPGFIILSELNYKLLELLINTYIVNGSR